ncbi:MAG: VOC family protein [Gemmatimonadetes bacterium]|nr:VOC family protein [Gemmatimonadota bacterium]
MSGGMRQPRRAGGGGGAALAAVVVSAAVIWRDGHVLLTRRMKGSHLAGLWEFPGGKVELLEPLDDDDSPIGRFLERHGEGLHHVSFDVPDVRETIMAGIEHGVETVGEAPRTGAEGREIAFFHPLFTHGVLVEVAGPTHGAEEPGALAGEIRELGRRLGDVLERAWTGEERRRLEEGVRSGLRSVVDDVDDAVERARESETATRVRHGAKEAGHRTRGQLAESLRWLSGQLESLAERFGSTERDEKRDEPETV